MTFRYGLGAAVVLITSAPLILEDLHFEHEEANKAADVQDEGDFAQLAALRPGLIEEGTVIARTEFLGSNEDQYLLRYRAGDGKQTENWFYASALTTREAIEATFQAEIAAVEEAKLSGTVDAITGQGALATHNSLATVQAAENRALSGGAAALGEEQVRAEQELDDQPLPAGNEPAGDLMPAPEGC